MGPRQVVLAVIFGAHWLGFCLLLIRDKRPALLLPMGVFTLLVLTQLYWDSSVGVELGMLGPTPLPRVLRVSAIVLAVPSIGLMVRRIVLNRRTKISAADGSTH